MHLLLKNEGERDLLDVTEPGHELLAGDGLTILVLVSLTYQPAARVSRVSSMNVRKTTSTMKTSEN